MFRDGSLAATASLLTDPSWRVGLPSESRPYSRSCTASQLCATICREQMQQRARLRNCGYSITSSRRASWDGGTVILSAFAVFMVIASLYLVGAWTGISRRIRPAPHLLQRTQSGERTGGTVARA